MVWLKRTVFALITLLALLAATIAWLLFTLDANQYKPQLKALAAEQGIALTLDGNVGWQLWPDIALKLDGVKLAPLAAPDQQLLQADTLAVRVALIPLLKQQVEAQEILLLKPQIKLSVDAQGRGNWEPLIEAMNTKRPQEKPKLAPIPTPTNTSDKPLRLALAKLRLEQGFLSYTNAETNTQFRIEQLYIAADNLVLGSPGHIELQAQLQGDKLKQPVHLKANTDLTINEGLNTLHLQPLTISLTSGAAAAQLSLRGTLQRKDNSHPWQIQIHLNADAKPLGPWLTVTGSTLTTQSADALQRLNLETDIAGTPQQLSMESLQLRLDDTLFTGKGALRSGDRPAVEITLKGDTLALDKYLPASTATMPPQNAPVPTPPPKTASTPAPLSFASLRGFDAKLTLSLQTLLMQKLEITQPELQLTVDNGLYQLHKLSAELYGGKLNSSGQFNARNDIASAEMSGGLTNVEIAKVQQALFAAQKVQFSGIANLTWALQTSGANLEQLQQQLRGAARVDGQELVLTPFNLEKNMCQLISYVEKTPLPSQQWPARTQLQNLHANINLRGDQVLIQQINAGIENIALTGDGDIDLQKQHFDFALGLALTDRATSSDGCTVSSKRWHNRPLPLRCEGNFSTAGIDSCKPDSRRLDDLLREELKYQAEKKYGTKAKKKLNELKDKLKGLLGG